MTENDFDQFEQELARLAAVHEKTLDPDTIAAYFATLAPYPLADITAACRRAARELEWFPKPAQIIKLIQGSPTEKAELAWNTLCSLIREGSYCSLQVNDPAFAYAIRVRYSDWPRTVETLAVLSPEMMANEAKHFTAIYQRGLSSAEGSGGYFIGLFEQANRGQLSAIAIWSRKTGSKYHRGPVAVVRADGYEVVQASFDCESYELTTTAKRMLESGNLEAFRQREQSRLAGAIAPLALPPISTEPITIKEIAEIRDAVNRMADPTGRHELIPMQVSAPALSVTA